MINKHLTCCPLRSENTQPSLMKTRTHTDNDVTLWALQHVYHISNPSAVLQNITFMLLSKVTYITWYHTHDLRLTQFSTHWATGKLPHNCCVTAVNIERDDLSDTVNQTLCVTHLLIRFWSDSQKTTLCLSVLLYSHNSHTNYFIWHIII